MSGRPTIRTVGGDEALDLADAVWPCYDTVFGDVADVATWRSEVFERHAGREGFRLVLTSGTGAHHGGTPDAHQPEGAVTGFAWGYVGRRGQYWADLVHDTLPPDLADLWVGDHFEVVELAVLPAFRRHGLGRALHDQLLDGVRRRCLLGTADDPDDPAVRLYLRSGWTRLGSLGPGVQVMGRAPFTG